MAAAWREIWFEPRVLFGGCLALMCGAALAQPASQSYAVQPSQPVVQQGIGYPTGGYVTSDQSALLRQALQAAKIGDTVNANSIRASLSDPVARKLVEWALADSAGARLDYYTLSSASRDLQGWPRATRLRAALEKSLETAALPPNQIVTFFDDRGGPQTPEGAMALAAAYQALGRTSDAQTLIRSFWDGRVFGADDQARMMSRFGAYLTQDDYAKRLDMLLYGDQGPAVQALLAYVTPDQRAMAEARIALRADRSDAAQLVAQLPAALQITPGVAFEHARYYRKHNLESLAIGLLRYFPTALPQDPDIDDFVWTERRVLMNAALRTGDYAGAYAAASHTGLTSGSSYTEAEFFAGWLALSKLHNPDLADSHFAKLQAAGATPITLSRALYWRGRAAEAKGDAISALNFWNDGAKYTTAFYGQLSAAKLGQTTLNIGNDPVPSATDRARFDSREIVRAARLLGDLGERDLYTTFALAAADQVSSAAELALLVDMTRMYAGPMAAMRVVRAGAMHNLILPDRGYPVVSVPVAYGAAEPAFSLAIARQESNFDPYARSRFAVGLMQLRPETAAIMARKIGVAYSSSRLTEPEFNVRLGSSYLGGLVSEFGGSYVLATAAYNAGPGRPREWIGYCGDPRQGAGEPADFIECIPFSETRNYVERVMENMQVYRARLNGGSAPLTLAEDLKRGGWTAPQTSTMTAETAVAVPASLPR